MIIVRSLSVTCVAARRAFLVLLALVVLVAFGASGREWTSCGLGVLELWPSVGCLSPSLTYRFLTVTRVNLVAWPSDGRGRTSHALSFRYGSPGKIFDLVLMGQYAVSALSQYFSL